ncbi:MAG: ribosome biogenesis GTPase YlqF [Bacilli bacterium]|nr:ribosome biogenesis GTPase YlqF [Bacilli bacterium]
MAQQGVHYFPGHMQKALRALENYIKVIDLVVEIVDARAPFSSRNPLLDNLAGDKARLVLLSKMDRADEAVTKQWLEYFSSRGITAVAGNLTQGKFIQILSRAATPLMAKKREKEARFGMKKQPIRTMVIGIPNVGKSTLINNLCGKKKVVVGNKAGVTRAEQWIKLGDDFTILDTPGVLPMNYPDGAMAVRLALLGCMKEEVLPTEDLAYALLGYLKQNYPNALKERFGIENIAEGDSDDIFLSIAKRRLLLEGNEPSLSKACYLLIKEFKDGLLGRFSLETPDA